MNRFAKAFIVVAVLAYFIWPFDLMPGVLIDDIIVAVLGFLANNRLQKRSIT